MTFESEGRKAGVAEPRTSGPGPVLGSGDECVGTSWARPDTTDMVLVHRAFRREFGLAPWLIRSVRADDTARVEQVAKHITEFADALLHHHSGEDDLVWPKLLQRAQPDTDLVIRMQSQHEAVAGLLAQVQNLLCTWRTTGNPATGQMLAERSEQLSAVLDEHLAEEEKRVLPLVEEHLSVAEWAQVGERGLADTPKNRLLFFLGAALEEATPAEQADFLPHVPLPGRIAYRLIGRRQYRRHVAVMRAGLPVGATAAARR